MNINLLANRAVTSITHNTIVYYFEWTGIDNSGEVCIPSYSSPLELSVMIQDSNDQVLGYASFDRGTYGDGYASTRIYKRLFINKHAHGLVWPEFKGQDKFLIDGTVWYVIKVVHDFNNQRLIDGWVELVIAMSTDRETI